MARRAGKSPSRLDMRREVEAAEKLGESAATPVKKKAAAKKKATTVRRKTKKKVSSDRLRMVWGVFDNGSQQVASFPYPERVQADLKAEEMTAKGRGVYYVQPVKEPYEEDEAEE